MSHCVFRIAAAPLRGLCATLALLLVGGVHAAEPAWTPTKAVEVVVGVGPGGSMDRTARMLRDALAAEGLVPAETTVANKPGGGHAVAFAHTLRQAGNPHVIQVVNSPVVTNKLLGRSPIDYTQFTPLAVLFDEQFLFAVKSDSPIRDARDLFERVRQDPASVSFSVSSGVGTLNHIAAVQLAQAAGADIQRLKTVSFGSAAEGVTATLGGHVDVAITTPFSLVPFAEAGRLRLIAVAAGKRLPGAQLEGVPTWRELGADVEIRGWRVVVGPPDLTPEQVRFWEEAIRRVTLTPQWQAELERNHLTDRYGGSEAARQLFDSDAARLHALYTALGRLGN
ncbi:tripartite tricarboxylate transporter substrate binding protein [Pseudothauera rhizosphaerae]|nr:tripartite tricarboxylate transporter substrate binding protein [Pseudothauera rhizosphaerae]